MLPSFLNEISADNLQDADFDLIYYLMAKELDKIRIAHHVLSQKKPYDAVVVSSFNSAIDLAQDILEKRFPLDMLGKRALRILLGQDEMDQEGLEVIQANLDEITNMSRDLRFVLSNGNELEFIDLRNWIYIPEGILTGARYTVLAQFKVKEFLGFFNETNWIKLAAYRRFEKKIQFYTPDPSPTFFLTHDNVKLGTDIEGVTSRLVESDDPYLDPDILSTNANMIRELQVLILDCSFRKLSQLAFQN